jgi:hypothetical protein
MADFNQATSNPVALSTPVTIPSVGQSIDATAAGIVSIFEQIAFDASISGKLMGSVTGQTVRAGGFVMPTVGQLWELGIPMQGITAPVRTTDVDAAAQIDRIEAAEAVTLSNPVRAAINQLVVDMKAAGVYSKIRYMVLPLGMPTIAGCRVPFKDNFLNYAAMVDLGTNTPFDHSPTLGVRFPTNTGLRSPSNVTALQLFGAGSPKTDNSIFCFYHSPGATSTGPSFVDMIYGPGTFPSTRGIFLGTVNPANFRFDCFNTSGATLTGFVPESQLRLFVGTQAGTSEATLLKDVWSVSDQANDKTPADGEVGRINFTAPIAGTGQESFRYMAAGFAAAMTESEARAFQTALRNYRLAIAAATVGEEPVIDVPFDNSANNYAGNSITTTTVNAVTITGGEGVFNGSTSYFKIGPESTASTLVDLSTTDFTVEFEITRTGTAANQRIFTQQRVNNDGTFVVRTAGTNGNNCEVLFLVNPVTVIGSLTITNAWPLLNQKYKASVELVGNQIRVIIDNVLRGTAYLSATRFATGVDNGTWIGSFHSAGEVLNGRLDNLKLWRSARYAPELTPHRYWRFVDIVIPGGGFLEITELRLYRYGLQNSSGTISSSSAPTNAVTSLTDGNLGSRCYWAEAVVENPAFWIKFSFASAVEINGVAQGGYDGNQLRYMESFTLQYSDDNTNWTTLGRKTGLTWPGAGTLSSFYTF